MAFEIKITGEMVKRALIGLLAAAIAAGVVVLALFLLGSRTSVDDFVEKGQYQAVFLNDGRVFFGHLRDFGDEYYEMRDAFFIQQVQGAKKGQPSQEVRPLSTDIHGPESRMLIPKDAVVVIENLRTDAELAKTIERLKTTKK